jgi:hypothetical protein
MTLLTNFAVEISDREVTVSETTDGHVFHFPILSNGTISLHGSCIERNAGAKRDANRSVFEACNAGRAALSRARISRGDDPDKR